MSERSRTYLFDRAISEYVDAEFIDGIKWPEIAAAESAWKPAMDELVRLLAEANVTKEKWPQHRYWNWNWKFLMSEVEGWRTFGVRRDLQIQGLMIADENRRSRIDADLGLTYINFVATAPWNLSFPPVQAGRYAQVGRVLFASAVQLSRESGHEGRVGLYAIRQSLGWYKGIGMVEFERENIEVMTNDGVEVLHYCEMTPETATTFLPEVSNEP